MTELRYQRLLGGDPRWRWSSKYQRGTFVARSGARAVVETFSRRDHSWVHVQVWDPPTDLPSALGNQPVHEAMHRHVDDAVADAQRVLRLFVREERAGEPTLHALLRALEERRKPPLEWVFRWSPDGRDPVLAAWEASTNPMAMVRLLATIDHPSVSSIHWVGMRRPHPRALSSICNVAVIWRPRGTSVVHPARSVAEARDVRRRAGVAPTLADVQAWLTRGGAPVEDKEVVP